MNDTNVTHVQTSLKERHESLAHQNLQHVKSVLQKTTVQLKMEQRLKCENCLQGTSLAFVPVKQKQLVHVLTHAG